MEEQSTSTMKQFPIASFQFADLTTQVKSITTSLYPDMFKKCIELERGDGMLQHVITPFWILLGTSCEQQTASASQHDNQTQELYAIQCDASNFIVSSQSSSGKSSAESSHGTNSQKYGSIAIVTIKANQGTEKDLSLDGSFQTPEDVYCADSLEEFIQILRDYYYENRNSEANTVKTPSSASSFAHLQQYQQQQMNGSNNARQPLYEFMVQLANWRIQSQPSQSSW